MDVYEIEDMQIAESLQAIQAIQMIEVEYDDDYIDDEDVEWDD